MTIDASILCTGPSKAEESQRCKKGILKHFWVVRLFIKCVIDFKENPLYLPSQLHCFNAIDKTKAGISIQIVACVTQIDMAFLYLKLNFPHLYFKI